MRSLGADPNQARDGRQEAPSSPPNESPARLARAQGAYELGAYNETLIHLEAFLSFPEDRFTQADWIEAQLLLGKVLRERGDYERSKCAFEAALVKARDSALSALEATALNQLASIHALQGDGPAALGVLEQAAALFKALGQMDMWATVLTNAGDIHRELSDYQEALTVLRKAYDYLKDACPSSRTTAINLQNLGLTYAALGNRERARAFYEEALEIAVTLGDPITETVSRINLAEVHLETGHPDLAESFFEAARAKSEAAGLTQYHINALEGLGNVYYEKSLYARAKAAHAKSVDLAVGAKNTKSHLDGLILLARDEFAASAFAEALPHAQAALLLAEQTERPRSLYLAHELLFRIYKAQGAFERALYHLEAFHTAKEQIFNEENADKTRRLALKFDVEKARHEAEVYRLKSELSERAAEQAERLVQARTAELEEAQLEIVTRLAVAAEYRDDDTGEHTRRVGRTAAVLAHVLGWPLREVQLLYTAARLHDVGKIGIADAILLKPGKLTEAEFEIMRSHASIGAAILEDGHSPLLKLAETIALAHHERWDGRGYPLGLEGEGIPQAARIVAVADVVDALTHERPYKKAWPVDTALAEIARNKGGQFDPEIVTACLAVFGEAGPLSPLDSAADWDTLLSDLDKLAPISVKHSA